MAKEKGSLVDSVVSSFKSGLGLNEKDIEQNDIDIQEEDSDEVANQLSEIISEQEKTIKELKAQLEQQSKQNQIPQSVASRGELLIAKEEGYITVTPRVTIHNCRIGPLYYSFVAGQKVRVPINVAAVLQESGKL